jgi:ElaB/YqjD/DUF883 family membrane-anchored ribosome-binding protein
MQYDGNDLSGRVSDQEKFGNSDKFGGAASSIADAGERTFAKVGDAVENAESTLSDRTIQLKTSLADKLDSGAGALRSRVADTSGLDNAVDATKEKLAGASDRVATGMEQSADWLRKVDMSSMQRTLEKHVKESPGRTLLIAAGVGYLLGRVLKGNNS